jgi:hypothetical protein
MKTKYLSVLAALGTLLPVQAWTQMNNPLQQQDKDTWRRQETPQDTLTITPRMKNTISAPSLLNITEAEQAFCYTVEMPQEGYTGYTIDSMAVTGFCGILSKPEMDLFIREFLSKDENVSNVVDQCVIKPRVLLRFMRGVDYSDVLFSVPCYSFTVFYAGNISSFNTSPAAKTLTSIVEAYEKKKMQFISPALLGQVLPIGVPQNDAQRALVKSKLQQGPVRNWAKKDTAAAETAPQSPQAAQPSRPQAAPSKEGKGWNRLKFSN